MNEDLARLRAQQARFGAIATRLTEEADALSKAGEHETPRAKCLMETIDSTLRSFEYLDARIQKLERELAALGAPKTLAAAR